MSNPIFERLYKEFEDECIGRCHLMVNDRTGYSKWYKERLFRLCINYCKEIMNMEIPLFEEIVSAVKRVVFDEKYIKMFPIGLQDQIRCESKNYKGAAIESIFNIVALSVHNYLVEFSSGKVTDNET